MQFRHLTAEYILGTDAIIHVASPLPDTGTPEVILDVRDRQTSFSASWLIKCIF
jgi:hypothetical protein